MIELNLLPDVKKQFIKAQRTRNVVIGSSIIITGTAAAIVVLTALYVYGAQALLISARTNDIKRVQTELKSIPEVEKYLTVQNQLSNIDTLHSKKLVYSRVFDYLQQLNPSQPNNIILSSVIVSKESGTMTIEGTASNFQAVNVFQTTLSSATLNYKVKGSDELVQSPLFTTVLLSDTGLVVVDGGSVARFEFTLTTAEEAFLRTSSDLTVSIPNEVTSDGDRNAPKVIFGNKPEDN